MIVILVVFFFFFFQAEDGIRDVERSPGLGDVYKRQDYSGISRDTAPPDGLKCTIQGVLS